MLAAAAALLLTSSLCVAAAAAPPGAVGRVLCVFLAAWAQIVLLSEVLSELHALGATGFLTGQAIFTILAFAAWVRAGRPPLLRVRETAPVLLDAARAHPVLVSVAVAAGAAWAVNAGWSCLYPPLDGDANAYHLPRAYYWTTLGTARHFPTSDFRLTQMPPDSSFLAAWVLAFSRTFPGLHLFQSAAGVALAWASAGLARLTGARRSASAFAGLLVLAFPVVVLQMGTAQNDLLVAAAGVAALYVGLRAFLDPLRSVGRVAAWFGVALGLGAGTKLTAAFLAPALAGALLLVAATRRRSGLRPLAFLTAAAVLGILLFAAYNAILNVREFVSPIATEGAFSHFYEDRPGARGLLDVAGRYAAGLASATPDAGRTAFGPLALVLALAAPFVFVRAVSVWRRGRDEGELVRGALVLVAAGYLGVFLALRTPFFADGARFFVPAAAILGAAVFPLAFRRRGAGWLVTVAVSVLAAAAALPVLRSGPDGVRRGAYREPVFVDQVRERVVTSLVRTLRESFPPGARFGVVSEYNDTIFQLLRALPDRDFVPVDERAVPDLVARGEIAAAIVGEFRNAGGQGVSKPGIAIPRNVLYVRDPVSFFREHPEQFALTASIANAGLGFRLEVDRSVDWTAEPLLVRVPSVLIEAAGSAAELALPLDGPSPEGVTASCAGRPLAVRAGRSELRVRVPSACGQGAVFADLVLNRPSGQSDIQVKGEARLGLP